uniref:Transcription factor GAMYB n=1 Tax=Cajanus cajan TaxID=3821 RepID=A0A151RAV2_CAJCA|nr:Transcription factor GAMYB [Cajanus cajan]
MHGKKEQEEEYIRKGPWKAEEDEVLLNHVKKYGPRDWSSIRSKGLLQRTGKSCRLRWVNKLRPNLKNGCKFSLEEERVVIELQAQFGNRWAKIATYLTGRTDNDVKNFWSSRQKRLARILQTSATKSQKNKTKVPTSVDVPTLEAPKFSSSSEGEPSSKPHSCSLPFFENSEVIKMVSLPDLIKPELPSSHTTQFEQEFTLFDSYENTEQNQHVAFPQIPELHNDLAFSMDEPCFIEDFGPLDASEFGTFFESPGSCRIGTRDTVDNSRNSDSFFDDFPVDMFDHMDPTESPSNL